mmetsp:Transcript_3967/g.5272  ORF Transcript_3967/g.5272 Transcript_3967/m.5272 type:complete len:111 (-) Transcript_3967:77-409(-)
MKRNTTKPLATLLLLSNQKWYSQCWITCHDLETGVTVKFVCRFISLRSTHQHSSFTTEGTKKMILGIPDTKTPPRTIRSMFCLSSNLFPFSFKKLAQRNVLVPFVTFIKK